MSEADVDVALGRGIARAGIVVHVLDAQVDSIAGREGPAHATLQVGHLVVPRPDDLIEGPLEVEADLVRQRIAGGASPALQAARVLPAADVEPGARGVEVIADTAIKAP